MMFEKRWTWTWWFEVKAYHVRESYQHQRLCLRHTMQNHRGTVIPYATSAALITTVPVVRTAAVVFTNPADSNSSLNQQGHFSEGVLPTVTSSTNEARFGARIRPRELWLNLPGLILRCLKDWDEILSACSKLQCWICCNSGHLKKSRKPSLNSSPRSSSFGEI